MTIELEAVKTFFNKNKQSIPKGVRPILEANAAENILKGTELNTDHCPRYLVEEFKAAIRNDAIAHANTGKEFFKVKQGADYLAGGAVERW